MTPIEAREILNGIDEVRGELPEDGNDVEIALMMAKDALEEIQQYRAIGTVKEIKIREAQFKRLSEGYLIDLSSLREYREIGTIDEFKALKEEVELYRNLDKTNFSDGYNRAIDDFVENIALGISESFIWGMLVNCENYNVTSDKIFDYVIDTAKKIAEQMKGGAE